MTDKTKNTTRRSPVIAIMGHIDHGKSTLLDYIRSSNTTDGEAGGITQHLSAYEVNHKTSEGVEGKITFLDTPGHAAFSAIRSRGVNVADIAILVVSADDGVKTQTTEALKCIQKEGIPYIVAINKIDKPGADIEKTKQNLAENQIFVEGWGGDVPVVPISAKTGQGVSDLLDMMILVADLEDLKGDRNAEATGTVIESNMDPQKGISASLIIKDGTLKKGSFVASGDAYSPVRIMENYLGKQIDEASFSTPIRIIGWNKLPKAGSIFFTFDSKKEAESFVRENVEATPTKQNTTPDNEGKKVIPIIVRTDSAGSSDAVVQEISKIPCDDRICTHVLYTDVGAVSETDVKTAQSNSDTIILAFHTKIDKKALQLAERAEVELKSFDVIYHLTEWLTTILEERKPLSQMDEITGRAKILKTFSQTKDKQVIGGRMIEGLLKVGAAIKIMRKEEEIGKGTIKGAQQQKMDTKELSSGEFGMMVESNIKIAAGDEIAGFKSVEK